MDYKNGKIYRIVCNETGLQYIGSTTQKLTQRLTSHKVKYKGYLNEKYHYVTSFKILENNNFDIILIENCSCDNKEELHKRERYFIETMNCVNKNIPTRTDKEYRNYNKEVMKEYYENNKDKIKEIKKEYYENNKNIIKELSKEYYENNKNKIKERNSIKYNCECGIIICKSSKVNHLKSKKHLDYLEKNKEIV
jgi:hypothetical protein